MIHPRAGWFGSQLRILKLKDLFKPPVEKMNGKYFLNWSVFCLSLANSIFFRKYKSSFFMFSGRFECCSAQKQDNCGAKTFHHDIISLGHIYSAGLADFGSCYWDPVLVSLSLPIFQICMKVHNVVKWPTLLWISAIWLTADKILADDRWLSSPITCQFKSAEICCETKRSIRYAPVH